VTSLFTTQANKWIEKWDEYFDRVYFEHCETGEVVYDKRPEDRKFIARTGLGELSAAAAEDSDAEEVEDATS
jgi:hypothetical protein